jgi:hypothetical protein
MKIAAVLPFLFLSASAFAFSSPTPTLWEDLGSGDSLTLTQNLALDGKTGGTISVERNTEYTLESIEPLDGLGVVDLVFAPRSCATPETEGELTLVLPEADGPRSGAEVGIYFLKNCALEVLVEAKDYGKPSFFTRN